MITEQTEWQKISCGVPGYDLTALEYGKLIQSTIQKGDLSMGLAYIEAARNSNNFHRIQFALKDKIANTYTITFDNGMIKETMQVPLPKRLPQPNDIYQFTVSVRTPRGTYQIGNYIKILHRTNQAPHHLSSSLGNLLCECKYATSVWTGVEGAIVGGQLKLVTDDVTLF